MAEAEIGGEQKPERDFEKGRAVREAAEVDDYQYGDWPSKWEEAEGRAEGRDEDLTCVVSA